MSLINIAKITKKIDVYNFFWNNCGAKIAEANIGVKLGGCGINRVVIRKIKKNKKL